jgi:hypothetical protein
MDFPVGILYTTCIEVNTYVSVCVLATHLYGVTVFNYCTGQLSIKHIKFNLKKRQGRIYLEHIEFSMVSLNAFVFAVPSQQ